MKTLALLLVLILSQLTTLVRAAEPAPLILGSARFSVLSAECVRIEWAPNGSFVDKPSLFARRRPLEFRDFTFSNRPEALVLETTRFKLTYRPDGKAFHPGNLTALVKLGNGTTFPWQPGANTKRNLGGTLSSLDGIFAPVDLGEGLLARDGWYLLDDSSTELETPGWVEERPAGGTDWYLFAYGQDYKAALKALTSVSGKVPLPRKYALGSWYSRYWPHSSSDYRRIVEEYRANEFPLDVVVLDMDWHREGWTGWSWNRELLPDAKELLAYLHAQNLAVTLNVHPADGVGPHEDQYAAFMQALGEDPATRKTLAFDAGNERYLNALFKTVHYPLENEGVDFWWLDWQQSPFTLSLPRLTNLAWLNHEYYRHSGREGKRGLSFSRWAGWGDHRHPIHFSGDASTDWAMLEFEVPFTSTSGNVGCFYWSHDIGGHVGARDEEAFVRWVQFGSTSAALRLHSARNAELDRRPWVYSPQAKQAMREAFQLRSRLFPYIYSTAWQAHDRSLPPVRPMYLEHPRAEESYRSPQQYYFGDSFLVAPITSPGQGKEKVARQNVWLPAGRWFHWHSGEELKGNAQHLVSSSLDEFPLYAKGGVPVPMQPYTPRMSRGAGTELVIRAYPGEKQSASRYELYEDDGTTQGYQRSEYTLTELAYSRKGNEVTVSVSPPRGGFQGQPSERSYVVELPATGRATKARFDFGAVKLAYDQKSRTNIVRVPKRDVLRGLRITLVMEDAAQALLKTASLRRKQQQLLGGKPGDLLSLIHKASAADPARESLLALSGLGARIGIESPALHPGAAPFVEIAMGAGPLRATRAKARVLDRIGKTEAVAAELLCDGKKGSRCFRKLARLDLPTAGEEVVSAARRLELTYTVKGKNILIEKPLERLDATLRRWRIVGPFAYTKETPIDQQGYDPERGGVDLSASYRGIPDRLLVWEPRSPGRDGILASPKDPALTGLIGYAVTYLQSDANQEVTLSIGSDDAVEAWLDGKKFHSHNVFRPINDKPDKVKLSLTKGNHTLLFKISNKVSGWSLRVAVDSPEPLKHSDSPY